MVASNRSERAESYSYSFFPRLPSAVPLRDRPVWRSEEGGFAFRACRDVAEGSELCISYVGEAAAEPEERARQVELLGWAYGIPVPSAPQGVVS